MEREQDLRAGRAYCSHPLPESKALKSLRKLQHTVADKLQDLQPVIDDEVRLRSELIGHRPKQAGDKDTIADLIEEYSGTYIAAHDKAQQAADAALKAVRGIVVGDEMQGLLFL